MRCKQPVLPMIILCTLTLFSCGFFSADEKQNEIIIAAVYAPFSGWEEAVEFTLRFNENEDILCRLVPCRNTDEALLLLGNETADFAVLRSDRLYRKAYGLDGEGTRVSLRSAGALGTAVFYPQISGNGPLGFQDLAGGIVNTGPPRSDIRAVSGTILKSLGLRSGIDFREEGLLQDDARRTVLWESMDAVFVCGRPLADLEGLSLSPEDEKSLLGAAPYFSVVDWPTLTNPSPSYRKEIRAAALPYFACGTENSDIEMIEAIRRYLPVSGEFRCPIPRYPLSEGVFFPEDP